MISFENVSFTYAANPEEKNLSDISLTINDGECVLFTGPSGCGKSTLLRLLNGLIPEFYDGVRCGTIRIDGQEITDNGIYDFVGRIGTVFQNPRSQFFNVDTTSELAFGCENLAFPEEEILDRIEKTVSRFHIKNLMDRSIFELSGGEKQKIACGSVDVLAPDIILLDEPSANLDYESTLGLRDVIREWKRSGKTILIAEHRMGYVWELADKIVILGEGRTRRVLNGAEKKNFTEEMCAGLGLRSTAEVSPAELANRLGYGAAGKNPAIILKNFSYSYSDKKEVFHIDEMTIPNGICAG
ncbi:ABC transporter ATP-binding protein [Lachnoclostridium sp. Marseille-P6806]|uniref:ABC transporter ATP-binding protein n=1 Tax=Lachnoclostridium sp. Marseille-P6806 TaxID=2364793 RepID=UPI0013EF2E1F|nr:ABC transporter ATP-binding protein [Lachnoclostridium sp. Marseille-P6806]